MKKHTSHKSLSRAREMNHFKSDVKMSYNYEHCTCMLQSNSFSPQHFSVSLVKYFRLIKIIFRREIHNFIYRLIGAHIFRIKIPSRRGTEMLLNLLRLIVKKYSSSFNIIS
jgi:hypothetical protein